MITFKAFLCNPVTSWEINNGWLGLVESMANVESLVFLFFNPFDSSASYRDERVLPDQWLVLVSEWSSENGRKKARWAETTQAELFILTCTCKNGQPVNEETAAIIEASSGDCKVLHWEFYMGFLPVVIFQFEKMWILLLSKFTMKAYANSFYFDFTMTYIRAGMICSHLVNSSLLAGALLSYGVMWPLIGDRKGDLDDNNEPQDNLQRDEVF
ncbi:metal-nicotianamine transporter YSL3-like protein [Tanacetum coccineum]